jgi:hypothetical protein
VRTIQKVLPMVIGVSIAWLFFHPPAFLRELGPLGWLLGAAGCVFLLVLTIAFVTSMNLPADVAVAPLDRPPDPALAELAGRIRALGFADAGPPYEIGMSPPATLVALVHPGEPVYAAAYRTGTVPPVLSFDFVSILDGFRGALTTNPDVRGATLPPASGAFRQVFPGGSVGDLYARHLDGVAFLRARGFACKRVTAATFVGDFKRAIARQREAFLAAPLGTTLVAIVRSVTGKVPDIGPLAAQPEVEERLRQLGMGLGAGQLPYPGPRA